MDLLPMSPLKGNGMRELPINPRKESCQAICKLKDVGVLTFVRGQSFP